MNEMERPGDTGQADAPAVICRGLRKAFSSGAETLQVLDGLDLEAMQGSSTAIMGASGSGKSTLLAILGGLERLDSGQAWAGPYALHSLQERDLPAFRSTHVGFVFQFHYLLKDFTALENVALPAYQRGMAKKLAWQRARELLESLGLGRRLDHFPGELSGGERQRAAIARALVNSPKLLLADEPTGSLDAASAENVADILFSLPPSLGATLIVATHDERIASRAQRRLLLSAGRLS